MPLHSGTRLGPYEIRSALGTGGMGEVYRAHDTRLDRDVAIKVLPPAFAADPVALARFEREAKAVAALSHPNILAIHDVGRDREVSYAVMELLEGDTLRERLTTGPLPPRQAIDYAVQIANGLAAAHDKGLIHRDLKPENLFVTRDERVKILDFGLAKPLDLAATGATVAPTAGTTPGMIVGTVGYMAPEQVRGQQTDHRSDLFAFGAVLYELVTGQRAFTGESPADTISAILHNDPPELAMTSGAVPPAGDRIVFSEIVPDVAVYLAEIGKGASVRKVEGARTENGGMVAAGWSRDGRQLAGYIRSASGVHIGIAVYDFATDKARQLTKDSAQFVRWLPDNRHVVYFPPSGELIALDTISGVRRTVEVRLPLSSSGEEFSVAPDGKTIYYGDARTEADIWVVERGRQ